MIPLPGKGRSTQGQGLGGWWVSNSECCSSTRATIKYRKKKLQNAGRHCQMQLPPAQSGARERKVLLSQNFSWGHLLWWNLFKPFPVEHLGDTTTYRGLLRLSGHSQPLFPQEIGSSLCVSMLAENTSSGPAAGLGFVWPFPRAHKRHLPHQSTLIRSSCGNSSISTPGREMLPSDVPLRQY